MFGAFRLTDTYAIFIVQPKPQLSPHRRRLTGDSRNGHPDTELRQLIPQISALRLGQSGSAGQKNRGAGHSGGSFIQHYARRKGIVKKEKDCPDHRVALQLILEMLTDPKAGAISDLKAIKAVGHRVVHGGEKFAR